MQKHIRLIISIFIITLFCAQPVGLRLPLFDRLDNLTYDTRLKYTAPHTVDSNIVIVDIDEKSLAKLGQWPWDRDVLAKIVDNLFDHYTINTVGFDMFFSEPETNTKTRIFNELATGRLKNDPAYQAAYRDLLPSLDHDAIFGKSLANRKTVLGFAFIYENQGGNTVLPEPAASFDKETSDKLNLYHQTAFTGNLPVLQKNAYSGGFVDNPSIDNDGVFRRVPLLQLHNGDLYESLAFKLFRTAIGSPQLKINLDQTDGEEYFIDWIKVGSYEIPVDQQSNVLVPYRGRSYSFTYISAVDVFDKSAKLEALKDAIVLIGTSAAGLKDLRTTPLETGFPGVEVHANIISGLIEDRIKQEPAFTYALEFLLLLSLGILLSLLYPRLTPLQTTAITLAILFILVMGNVYAWSSLNMVLPLTNSLLLVIALFGVHMSYGFFVETRNKKQITKVFGQYVPPELVDEISEHPEAMSIDGENRDMSVLFSDVRNFTTISENLEPKQLTQFINGFLTPMTKIIHQNRGTIDKYMGDAIMAFWGAPLSDEDHARHALLAGMEMVTGMRSLSEKFKQKGWPEIRVGVGINSGNMNVGNMGSEFRMAYTVMGDTVNLGSRLEGLTKNYGVDIIVSEFTCRAVPGFTYRLLDKVRVKGKDQPVTIYEPIGPTEEIDLKTKQELKEYADALESYLKQDWSIASAALQQLMQKYEPRKIYQIYLDRITIYQHESPGEQWDGVFTHKTK